LQLKGGGGVTVRSGPEPDFLHEQAYFGVYQTGSSPNLET